MPLTLEWPEIPFRLETEAGVLTLNSEHGTTGYRFILDPRGCRAVRPLRVAVTPVPQGDGDIHHTRYAGGYQVRLAVQLWTDRGEPACGADLVAMHDLLMLHLEALRNGVVGRLVWTPTGAPDCRMLDHVRLLEVEPPESEAGVWSMTFSLDSPFPYAITCTEKQLALTGSNVAVNAGNTEHWPVARVNGPTSAFVLTNQETGLQVVYSASLPGAQSIPGGSYAEIDMFRHTIYLNGNGPNLKPGLDLEFTDFWSLLVGSNTITLSGATGLLLYNDAWL